jgi:hypothetical protein
MEVAIVTGFITLTTLFGNYIQILVKSKSKAIPVTGRGGL